MYLFENECTFNKELPCVFDTYLQCQGMSAYLLITYFFSFSDVLPSLMALFQDHHGRFLAGNDTMSPNNVSNNNFHPAQLLGTF